MFEIAKLPMLGGLLIAIAVSIMLLFNGRITGISGIVRGLLQRQGDGRDWRFAFFLGLILGGFLLPLFMPNVFQNLSERSLPQIAFAGVLVGFGTAMANGCTSGHGVCGVARLSIRSILATLTFIFFGALTVFILQWVAK